MTETLSPSPLPASATDRAPAAATGADPAAESLDPCHAEILAQLLRLDAAVADYARTQGNEGLRRTLRDVVTFFDSVAAPHHLNEEREIFPLLLARGEPSLVQVVQRLQQDHGWLEQDWLELAPMLRSIGENTGWIDPGMIRELVDVFAGLYRDHIDLEESLVYPTSRRMTQEADRARQRRRLKLLPQG